MKTPQETLKQVEELFSWKKNYLGKTMLIFETIASTLNSIKNKKSAEYKHWIEVMEQFKEKYR